MLKVGIVGHGHIGKKHIQAIELIENVSLKSISDIQGDFPAYESILEDEEIDIISVCTPNSFHKEHTLMALKAGKHVICEKPFALSKEDCEILIDAALQSGKFLSCVMQNRFSPVSQWLKQTLDKSALGDILMVNVACYWNRDERYYGPSNWKGKLAEDGGTLFTQFAHYVDTLYFLFGGLEVQHAQFENFTHKELIEFEDSGNFSFQLKKGGIGNFQYSTAVWDKNFESSMTIVGSNGVIKVAGQYMDQVVYCHAKDLASPLLPKNDNIHNLGKIYANARDVILNNEKLMTNAMDGLKVVEIIENVYRFRSI